MASESKKTFTAGRLLLGALAGAFLVFWVLFLSGNVLWTSNQPPLQVIPDMDNQFKVKAQSSNHQFADNRSQRDHIEFTVPRNGEIYSVSLDEADIENVNDIPRTDIVVARGENRFQTFCAPCHGMDGKGEGPVVAKGFQKPPSLIDGASTSYTDGRIFHIISAGQNIMPSYADKLARVDRWAIVHYIRTLQGSNALPQATAAAADSTSATKNGTEAN